MKDMGNFISVGEKQKIQSISQCEKGAEADIPRQLTSLSQACAGLQSQVERIENKLGPVCRNEPLPADDNKMEASAKTELSHQILHAVEIIQSAVNRLHRLQNVIEL